MIHARLGRDMHDILIERFETIDSTSLHARRVVEQWTGRVASTSGTPHSQEEAAGAGVEFGPRVIVASMQTAGVGQRGRAWCSPRGGLWCTYVVPWREPLARGELSGASVGTLGIRIGLACVRTIEEVLRTSRADRSNPGPAMRACDATPAPVPMLKLPNDVLVGGKKILGVLTEVVAGPRDGSEMVGLHTSGNRVRSAAQRPQCVLIGVGINANVEMSELAPEVAPDATSLRLLIGRETDLKLLLDVLTRNLLAMLDTRSMDPATLDAVSARLHGCGHSVCIRIASGESVTGSLVGVNDDGQVVVQRDGGRQVGMLVTSGRSIRVES
ncbi:MAG: hypothetical protein H7210_05740 [Pyrinomonadaceae bacterium]|nr:hypothetical protein [Phycisphaerales bacterium]